MQDNDFKLMLYGPIDNSKIQTKITYIHKGQSSIKSLRIQ